MKTFFPYLILAGLLVFLNLNCESPTDPEEAAENLVRLNGQVFNATTGLPVDSAVVQVLNFSEDIFQITDSEGRFSIEIKTDKSTTVFLVAFKESFLGDTTSVLIVPGRTVDVPSFEIQPLQGASMTSGQAASIVLASQSVGSVGVHESGSPETAMLVFEVQDSMGVPVDSRNAVTLSFSMGSAPNGGEYLYPDSVTTSNGRARVYLSSGIKAGVVQLFAEATVDGKIIRSKSIAVAIHGGLPDSVHFSIAHEISNIPGWYHFGLEDVITAFVGDKYSNPVKPGTAVYFKTTGGIIQGSGHTDENGMASVNLYSAAPRPEHAIYGKGFATITGYTADENQNEISSTTLVLFSGAPMIDVDPTTFAIPNGGAQYFGYTVSDQNGNPLSEGTSITVTIDGEMVSTRGDISKSLPDTQSKGWTQFGFVLYDAEPDTVAPGFVSVTIETDGPNGGAGIMITGSSE